MRIVAQAYGPPKGGSARRSDKFNPSSQNNNNGRKASRQPSSRETLDHSANFATTPRNPKPATPGPAARKPSGTPSERQGQSKSTGNSKASSGRAGAGSGYSAGDRPERRKNPELYTGLQAAAGAAALTAPALSPLDLPPSSSTARTTPTSTAVPTVVAGDEPTVSYVMSASAHGHAAGAAGAAVANPRVQLPLAHKPEVLAPVGGWPQLRAAVENGADAVYFGCEDFNARARASNFSYDELPSVMSYLHDRGVKGFVALNVLVFDSELPQLEDRARKLAEAGVDAVIVQDWGAVELLRRVAPSLPVHGSTQMSITSAEGAAWAAGLGVERVVVGRELSVREIAKVREGTPGTEVEAFVHGALCVSYSGQCFSSEAWGGRSANRGQCAQACRLPYGLLVDGVLRQMGDAKYVLSPQDLMAVEQVPDLIMAGVACFKIEGRLKGPEYVALTTQVYRRAVDASWEALTGEAPTPRSSSSTDSSAVQDPVAAAAAAVRLTEQQRWDLEQVFARGQDGSNRGLTPGFLEGVRHQRLVRGRAPRHRGVFLGTVEDVRTAGGRWTAVVQLQAPLKRGDGVAFDRGDPEADEAGGVVYDILDEQGSYSLTAAGSGGGGDDNAPVQPGATVTLVLGPASGQAAQLLRSVSPGDLVWRTKDPALESRLKASYDSLAATDNRRLPVTVAVHGSLGSPLSLTLTDPDGRRVAAATEVPLAAAARRPLAAEDVVRALGPTLGSDTLAVGGEVDVSGLDLAAGLFLPASEIKSLRRRAVDALLAARRGALPVTRAAGLATAAVLPDMLRTAREAPAPEQVLQLIRSLSSTTSTTANTHAAGQAGSGGAEAGDDAGEDGEVLAVRRSSGQGASSSSSSGRGAGGVGEAAEGVCLRVLCRSREQVDAALAVGPWLKEVVVDFLEVQGLKEAVAAVRASGRRVVVATPRVLKPDEQRLWLFYLRLGADALLVRSAGMMHQLQLLGGPGATVPGVPHPIPSLEGDFSLNAANVLSAHLLLTPPSPAAAPAPNPHHQQQGAPGAELTSPSPQPTPSSPATTSGASSSAPTHGANTHADANTHAPYRGLTRLAPTHDLHAGQLADLARGLGPRAAQLEAVVHQHLPIFHTEHCVFCRFLSNGNSYVDCGHPCERHRLHLRDPQGADHLVLADMGCRNTVFNARAQSGVFFMRDLVRAGIRTLRVELVDEQPQHVGPLLEGYRDVLLGRRGPGDLWRWLATLPDANGAVHGVDAGSLQVATERGKQTMKPTAAALKQQQQQQQQQQQVARR